MKKDVICLMCPNGCHLTAGMGAGGTVEVRGNRCEKGIIFIRRVLASADAPGNPRVMAAEKISVVCDQDLEKISSFWGIRFQKSHPHIMPDGSPERTLFRLVIEDDRKQHYLLEKIPPRAYHTKMKIVKTLAFLKAKGMGHLAPYRANAQEQFIQEYENGMWQLAPFIHGVRLNRETYLYEGWRAGVLAEFLTELRNKSQEIPFFSLEKPFSLKDYVLKLVGQIEKHAPSLNERVRAIVKFLEQDFVRIHDEIPVRFCHGDYHPLNIIWSHNAVLAVIDWEFLGMKPEIYDAANMVGCLGMEHPSSLAQDLVVGFIARLREAGLFAEKSWGCFLEFVVALRFAWLSEWLRKDDKEMIALELEYMDLLIANREKLYDIWGLKSSSAISSLHR